MREGAAEPRHSRASGRREGGARGGGGGGGSSSAQQQRWAEWEEREEEEEGEEREAEAAVVENLIVNEFVKITCGAASIRQPPPRTSGYKH